MSKTRYNVAIHTADQYLAGTDSHIFLKLYGPLGESREVHLGALIRGNAFERNAIDRATIEVPESLGDIYKVDVRSDCMYAGAGWRLDYIKVQRQPTEKGEAQPPESYFSCKEYIDNKRVRTYTVISGLPVSSVLEEMEQSYDSGARICVPAHQSTTYTDNISVEVGYALTEITAFKISTNAQLSVQRDFNGSDKMPSLQAALQFALSTERSNSRQMPHMEANTCTVECNVTLTNNSDEEKVYAIYLNRRKRIHIITMGDYRFELPEYLNPRFDGVRELENANV